MERMANGEKPIDLRRSLEYGSQIIHAATTSMPETIYGNVRNAALITNLPDWAIVEVACTVDQSGIRPQHYGALPEHLAAINRKQASVQHLAVQAAETMDPEVVFQAMCLDPLTSTVLGLDDIRAMTCELLVAHRPFLPDAWTNKPLQEQPRLA